MSQEKAKELIAQGENVFVTGSGGTGKSYLIKQISDDRTLVTAPTGIAALNAGGVTCHRLFGLPLGLPTPKDFRMFNRRLAELFHSKKPPTKIIIDEIGMLRADMLDLINKRLQVVLNNKEPFGGIQVVVFGDFYQLEPIVSWDEKELFYEKYDTPFAFGAKCWCFKSVELTYVFRQEDERQVKILNSIRLDDKWSKLALQRVCEEAKSYVNNNKTLHLCCYKDDAFNINNFWYEENTNLEHIYHGETKGGEAPFKDAPVDQVVKLKKDCKVIICANGSNYVNGSQGIIKDFTDEGVIVTLDDERDVLVEEHTWEKYIYKKKGQGFEKQVEQTFTQIPLLLGWAITVHKSQGCTLDSAALDIGRGCFSHGMLYVALSRVKDLRELSIVNPIYQHNIIVRDEVREFYGN